MGVRFSYEEVERLVSLASSAPRGRTIGERIGETLDATSFLVEHASADIFLIDPASGRGEALFVKAISERDLVAYVEHYRHTDPMGKFIFGAPDRVSTLSDAATAREVDRSEYSDLLRPLGIGSIAGYSSAVGDGRWLAIGLHRPRRLDDFAPKERLVLDMVLPLVVRTIREHVRPEGLLPSLSPRTRDVALLAARGLRDREIAHELGIRFATVRTHLQSAYRKAGVSSRTELAQRIAEETARGQIS